MEFSQVLWITMIRALSVCLLATAAGGVMYGYLASLRSGRTKFFFTACLVAVLLTPSLISGYGWAHRGLSLIRYPWANELLYLILLSLRMAPLAAAVFYFMPPAAMTRSARFLARSSRLKDRKFFLHTIRNPVLVGVLIFLLAYQEFELASLLIRPAWSVWLFDEQVGGLALSRSLQLGALGALCELIVLSMAIVLLFQTDFSTNRERDIPPYLPGRAILAWGIALLAMIVVSLLPALLIVNESIPVMADFMADWPIVREIVTSMVLSFTAVCLAILIVLASRRMRFLWVLCPLGLMGPLVLALLAQRMFQTEFFSPLYDTPVPMILVLTLLLTPAALAVCYLIRRVIPTTSLQTAKLLADGDRLQQRWQEKLIWALRGRAWLYGCGILFLIGYFELVANDLLRPTGLMTAPSRLYNLMHYGHNHRLSAMVVAVWIAPVVIFFLGWGMLRLSYRLGHAWNERFGH